MFDLNDQKKIVVHIEYNEDFLILSNQFDWLLLNIYVCAYTYIYIYIHVK